jgi:putative chitinase
MIVTPEALIAAGIGPTQAAAFAEPVSAACAMFGIDTTARVATFVGQCAYESTMFVHLEESLYYREAEHVRATFPIEVPSLQFAATLLCDPEKLANVVYAKRNGNGDSASGDGWDYRGRGLIQLTVKNNYSDAETELGRPYLTSPELVGLPLDACLTAAWFWYTRGLNALADAGDWLSITKIINGSTLGAADRQVLIEQGLKAFAQEAA